MNSRGYHHGDLRSALLARAEETVRESGVEGLSLRQLARDLGVSHGAPRRHFKDKQALLDALAIAGFRRLQAVITSDPELGLRAQLGSLARAYVQFSVENSALLEVMFRRKHEDDAVHAASAMALAVPLAMITAAQDRGEVAAGDPTLIGIGMYATLQGLVTVATSDMIEPDDIDRVIDQVVRQILDGIAA